MAKVRQSESRSPLPKLYISRARTHSFALFAIFYNSSHYSTNNLPSRTKMALSSSSRCSCDCHQNQAAVSSHKKDIPICVGTNVVIGSVTNDQVRKMLEGYPCCLGSIQFRKSSPKKEDIDRLVLHFGEKKFIGVVRAGLQAENDSEIFTNELFINIEVYTATVDQKLLSTTVLNRDIPSYSKFKDIKNVTIEPYSKTLMYK